MGDEREELSAEMLAALGGEAEERGAQEAEPRLAGRRAGRRRGKRLVLPKEEGARNWSPEQRLLILDTWRRSGLPAGDFADLVDVSKHTLYAWKKAFDTQGPAGLMDHPRGAKCGSHLPELTKRAILMLKETNPNWGCQRISDALARGPALPASAGAVPFGAARRGLRTRRDADAAASR